MAHQRNTTGKEDRGFPSQLIGTAVPMTIRRTCSPGAHAEAERAWRAGSSLKINRNTLGLKPRPERESLGRE